MAKKKYKVWEKFMETKEQKIERLKKEIEEIKFYKSICIDTYAVGIYIEQIKKLEQELKELEDDLRRE